MLVQRRFDRGKTCRLNCSLGKLKLEVALPSQQGQQDTTECRGHVCLQSHAVFQSNPYALKEGGGEMSAWTSAGLQPSGGYYPYDPTLAAYG